MPSGGKRKNSGRKKLASKKVTASFSLKPSTVTKITRLSTQYDLSKSQIIDKIVSVVKERD